MPIRTKHEPTNLYCESGHGAYERETHIFLRESDKEPIRICKSALELAAYLGGWVDSKKCNLDSQDDECRKGYKELFGCHRPGCGKDKI